MYPMQPQYPNYGYQQPMMVSQLPMQVMPQYPMQQMQPSYYGQIPQQINPNYAAARQQTEYVPNNVIRSTMRQHAAAISQRLTSTITGNASTSTLDAVLAQTAQSGGYVNQVFTQMIQYAAALTEYYMLTQLPLPTAISNAVAAVYMYFKAQQVNNPMCQGKLTAAESQNAVAAMQTFQQQVMPGIMQILNSPDMGNNGSGMMITQNTMGPTAIGNADPRFGGGYNTGMNMSNLQNHVNMNVPGYNQQPGMQPMQHMSPPSNTQSPVSVSKPFNNGQANPLDVRAYQQQANQQQQPQAPVAVKPTLPTPSYGKVNSEIGTTLPQTPTGLPNRVLVATTNMDNNNNVLSVLNPSMDLTIPVPVITNDNIIYHDRDVINHREIGNSRPLVLYAASQVGYYNRIERYAGHDNLEEKIVDYSKHRTAPFIRSLYKPTVIDDTKFFATVRDTAIYTAVKEMKAKLDKESAIVDIDDATSLLVKNVNIGFVLGTGESYHSIAMKTLADLEINLDIENSVVKMTVVRFSPFNLGKRSLDVVKAIDTSSTWQTFATALSRLKPMIEPYAYAEIEKHYTDVYQFVLNTMLDLDITLEAGIVEEYIEVGKYVSELHDYNQSTYTHKAFSYFKSIVGSLDRADLYTKLTGDEDHYVGLTTIDEVFLLPLNNSQITLVCPENVGVVIKQATPEFFDFCDQAISSGRLDRYRILFVTLDGSELLVDRELTPGSDIIMMAM